jgi:hypothetical protein
MEPPLACTLNPDDASSRVAEWRAFFHRAVDRTERDDHRLCLRLNPSDENLLAAVDLSRREMACCDFFEFAIEVRADANWLVVTVPSGVAAALDGLAGLTPG